MGFGKLNHQYRWPWGIVPFVIDPLSYPPGSAQFNAINTAIALWNSNTIFRLVGRTNEDDFVVFTPNQQACNSPVGRTDGQQQVSYAIFPAIPPGAGLSAIGQTDNQLDCFHVDALGTVRVSWVLGTGNWNGPTGLTGPNFAPPGAVLAAECRTDGQLDLFVVDN